MKKTYSFSGYTIALLMIIVVLMTLAAFISESFFIGIFLLIFILFLFLGFRVIWPNTAVVCLFLGQYKETIIETGFRWFIPFFTTKYISTKIHSTETTVLKVNDHNGNPILISAIIVWKVSDAYKALYAVESYDVFVHSQSESAVRKIASEYPYEWSQKITLSHGWEALNLVIQSEMSERLFLAGVDIIEARISHLAYAPEIAQAMLKKQQAQATIAARTQIVEGAVSMVDMALLQLSTQKIVELTPTDKAKMAMNLLTVLCSENVQPTLQTNPQN